MSGEAAAPSTGTAATQVTQPAPILPPSESIGVQVRRRRAASRRLPELADGLADPIDPPRRKLGAQTVVAEETRHSGLLYGAVRIIHPAIQKVGCRWQYNHQTHGYAVPRRFLDDVAAAIEMDGHRVDVRMASW